jgi:AcrR family transcriptional regulator
VNDSGQGAGSAAGSKRKDASRNQQILPNAAAAVFVTSGVEAPLRDIAAKTDVGMGAIYRHFPTREDLIIAVYRHQVDAWTEAGPALLASCATPDAVRLVPRRKDQESTQLGVAARPPPRRPQGVESPTDARSPRLRQGRRSRRS